MATSCASILLLFDLLLTFIYIHPMLLSLCYGKVHHPTIQCPETERDALIEFRKGLKDPGYLLSSWEGEDCCSWEGIGCNNQTGHIIQLDLQSAALVGNINSSLLGLKHLQYLDLSMNDFEGSLIPHFIGSFSELRYLNLSKANLNGTVPRELGKLSNLSYLDLSGTYSSWYTLVIDDPAWLSQLTSLQYLDMSYVSFDKAPNWLQALNMLPSITEIHLHACGLQSIPLSLPQVNFTSLAVLDLSGNDHINSTLPAWLFNISSLESLFLMLDNFHDSIPTAIEKMSSLEVLDLSANDQLGGGLPATFCNLCKLKRLTLFGLNFGIELSELEPAFSGCIRESLEELDLSVTKLRGHLPDWLGDLKHLKSLNLFGNLLYGSIPASVGGLSSLQELILASNYLNGTVPEGIGQLSELVNLDLSLNSLKDVLTESHVANLTKLKHLDITGNSLVLKLNSDWFAPFQLETARMSSCNLGPQFPAWLRTQVNCSSISMSNAGILDTMPDWFWNITSQISDLDLSQNEISGELPYILKFHDAEFIFMNLSSNHFHGSISHIPSNVAVLDLSDNSWSGSIPQEIGMTTPYLKVLYLSMNNLTGTIPSTLCESTSLYALDISKNHLSGELPDCLLKSSIKVLDVSNNNLSGELPDIWNSSSTLQVLDISNNNLQGGIPESICSIPTLESLHLNNNNLSGELPSSLKSCKNMVVLDLGHNKLKGHVPTWMGDELSRLVVLILRSNMFSGNLPPTLSHIPTLQILDVSQNNFSGDIPSSFGNFSAMVTAKSTIHDVISSSYYTETVIMSIKGREVQFDTILSLVIALDLSDNNLSGHIPQELSNLFGLQSMNLSRNHLTGEITQNIGLLQSIDSLDLSWNMLSGTIPSTLSNLGFLGFLNLSYNNLSGRIPADDHLDTFGASSFVGNPGLCGYPLNKKCQGDETNDGNIDESEEGENEMLWFYLGIGPGFAVGFWALWGILILKKTWRESYFRFIDYICHLFYMTIIAKIKRSRRRM